MSLHASPGWRSWIQRPGLWKPTGEPMSEAWGFVALLFIGFCIWGIVDIPNRGLVDPTQPLKHRTDFTVYTEAGEAFFDGRDPYLVTNPRGWFYMYPPLFAILVSPLAKLSPEAQVVVWYAISCFIAWGAYRECRRIVEIIYPRTARVSPVPQWIGWCALAAVALPTANCLQRGQVGVLVIYLVLLGARIALGSASGWRALAGGAVLAAPVVLKVTPLLPAGFFFLQQVAAWLCGSEVGRRRAFAGAAGFALGVAALLFAAPAAFIGWDANLQHLHTWHSRVIGDSTPGQELDFNPRALRNQSLSNAVNRLGNWIAYRCAGGPPDELVEFAQNIDLVLVMPMDAPWVQNTLKGVKAGLLLLLLAAGYSSARRGDDRRSIANFGLASALTLSISPISWGHHYTMLLPAAVFVPAFLHSIGRKKMAVVMALIPPVLVIGHYSFIFTTARAGMLGIGTALWIAAACGMTWFVRPRATSAVIQPAAESQPPTLRRAA